MLDTGDLLFVEGDLAHAVYRVDAGVLTLSRARDDGRRQVTGFVLPGEVCGSAAAGRFRCSATAAGATVVRAVSGMEETGASLPSAVSEHEFERARDQLRLLDGTADQRTAGFLLMLHARLRPRGGEPDLVPLPMSRRDIADYLGLTVESVARALGVLARSGAVALVEQGVRLRDPDRLAPGRPLLAF